MSKTSELRRRLGGSSFFAKRVAQSRKADAGLFPRQLLRLRDCVSDECSFADSQTGLVIARVAAAAQQETNPFSVS